MQKRSLKSLGGEWRLSITATLVFKVFVSFLVFDVFQLSLAGKWSFLHVLDFRRVPRSQVTAFVVGTKPQSSARIWKQFLWTRKKLPKMLYRSSLDDRSKFCVCCRPKCKFRTTDYFGIYHCHQKWCLSLQSKSKNIFLSPHFLFDFRNACSQSQAIRSMILFVEKNTLFPGLKNKSASF